MSSYRRSAPSMPERINEADVPESKHTVFIRGLPSTFTTDQVKEFLEEKFGPCNFDFVKVDSARNRLYIAVRFESKESARDCMERYKDNQIFGHDVELTWFRDIRRYIAYCQKKGIRPRPARTNPRYQRRYRSHSRSRSKTRSRSKSRSRSYSYSDHSPSRSRSRSRSTCKSSASPRRNEDRFSHHSDEDKKKRSPSSPRKKKSKKDKKKKKKRSPTRSSNSASDMDMSENELALNGSKVNDSKFDVKSAKKEIEQAANHSMGRISFNLDLDSNNPVIARVIKGGGQGEQPVNAVVNPKSSVEQEHKSKFIPVVEEEKPVRHENNNGDLDHAKPSSVKRAVSPKLNEFDTSGSALTDFRNIQKTILQDVRYKQPEIPDSPPTGGTLRLRTIQKKSPEQIREEKLARLSKELKEKVEKKKLQLELAYRQDCETFGLVAQNFIQKDRTLEERIRLALLECMKEMEVGILKQLDEYIDQLLFVAQ